MDNQEAIEILKQYPDMVINSFEKPLDYKGACNKGIEALQAWDEIEKSGMPTLVIEDCAYILTRGHIEALVKYNEEQNNKDLEDFGKFLKKVVNNEQ